MAEHTPGQNEWLGTEREARIAWRVYWAIAHSAKPCIGELCDEDQLCRRHERTAELAERMERRRYA